MKSRKTFVALSLLLLLIPGNSYSQDHQTWSYNQIIYEVNVRQYTADGTFSAFETHLERLQELGAGILWFMPIHPIGQVNRLGSLGSYYSVKDYLAINPEYGTMDDFKSLVEKIHQMGMYVIIDWVANHTAWDNSLTITHPDWYNKDVNGNFMPPSGTNWSDVIDLNYNKQELRDYMIDAMKFWIDEADIDGFRCDAVSWVPLDFWGTTISQLKSIKPGLFMLAEDDGQQYQTVGFDMSFAWSYHGFGNGVLIRIINDSNDANNLATYIKNEQSMYSDSHYRMYFTSNHDENSWYGTVFEQFGSAAEPFAVLTSLMNGMPLLYSGQEAGLNKRLQFFDKDQINWRQHSFSDIYSTLFNLKKVNKALWNGTHGGEIQRVQTTYDKDIFAFIREKDDDKVFVILNLSPDYKNVTLSDTLYYGEYVEIFTDDSVLFNHETTSISLTGWAYNVYTSIEHETTVRFDNRITQRFHLNQNYPNPFNLHTEIGFHISRIAFIDIVIYNSLGEHVKTIFSGQAAHGDHTVSWDSRNETGQLVSSGVYFYKIFAENNSLVRKMILLR